MPDSEAQPPAERRRWRLCFWLCFLLAPVGVLLVGLQPGLFGGAVPGPVGQFLRLVAPFGLFGTYALGSLGAGYCLAKLHAKPRTTAGLVGATIAFAIGLSIVHAAILFVGCLAIVSTLKF
jgi:hypothetical protein